MSEEATLDEFAEKGGNDEVPDEHPRFGSLPNDWKVSEISDIAEVVGGSTPSTSNDDYWGGGIPWATPTDITALSGNTISETEDTITEEGLESASTHLLPPNSVLMTSRATIGKCAINTVEMATNQGFKNLLPSAEIDPWYLYYRMLDTASFLNSLGSGSTFDEVSKTEVQSVDIPVPPLSEQRKIATVLYTVDRAIEKTEEVITQVERLRKGAMQNLFSRGVRSYDNFQETKYGTIPASWGVKPVREISDRIGSGGTPNTDYEEYYGGDIEWVKTDDLNSGLVDSAKTTITSQGLDESAAKLFPAGTVVFAMYGGALGQNGRLGMEAAMNQACCGIVTDKSEMNSYLLHQQLIHRKKQLTALSAGTHQQNISQSMIEKFEVFVPPLDEQKEMVDILKSIESTIEANTNQNERLKRLKQGLMQDLLSGKVRTTDTNIEVPEEIAQHG